MAFRQVKNAFPLGESYAYEPSPSLSSYTHSPFYQHQAEQSKPARQHNQFNQHNNHNKNHQPRRSCLSQMFESSRHSSTNKVNRSGAYDEDIFNCDEDFMQPHSNNSQEVEADTDANTNTNADSLSASFTTLSVSVSPQPMADTAMGLTPSPQPQQPNRSNISKPNQNAWAKDGVDFAIATSTPPCFASFIPSKHIPPINVYPAQQDLYNKRKTCFEDEEKDCGFGFGSGIAINRSRIAVGPVAVAAPVQDPFFQQSSPLGLRVHAKSLPAKLEDEEEAFDSSNASNSSQPFHRRRSDPIDIPSRRSRPFSHPVAIPFNAHRPLAMLPSEDRTRRYNRNDSHTGSSKAFDQIKGVDIPGASLRNSSNDSICGSSRSNYKSTNSSYSMYADEDSSNSPAAAAANDYNDNNPFDDCNNSNSLEDFSYSLQFEL